MALSMHASLALKRRFDELVLVKRKGIQLVYGGITGAGGSLRSSLQNAVELDTAAIADLLRETAIPLSNFEVDRSRPSGYVHGGSHDMAYVEKVAKGRLRMERLQAGLRQAKPDDALVIFKALAQLLEGASMEESARLMHDVLTTPWRRQAIDIAPAFFRTSRKMILLRVDDDVSNAANAFQVLALVDPDLHPAAATRDTIQALRNLGIHDFADPLRRNTCLHLAVTTHAPESFQAFVEAFPDSVNARNTNGECPLHKVLMYPDNARLLLDAGADPRPLTIAGVSPMHYASLNGCLDLVEIFIGTGAYSDDDVESVASNYANVPEIAERLRAYHAAVKVRDVIYGAGSSAKIGVKPL